MHIAHVDANTQQICFGEFFLEHYDFISLQRLFRFILHVRVAFENVSLAGVLLDAFAARATVDLAAPAERAFALPSSRVQPRVVSASATHRLAAGRRRRRRRRRRRILRRRPIAAPAARPQRSDARVPVAVARRRVEVDEVASRRLPVGRRRRRQRATRRPATTSTHAEEDGRHGATAADRLDATSAPVARRQAVADGAEARQSDPAGLH